MAFVVLLILAGLAVCVVLTATNIVLVGAAIVAASVFITGAAVCSSIERARRSLGGALFGERRVAAVQEELR